MQNPKKTTTSEELEKFISEFSAKIADRDRAIAESRARIAELEKRIAQIEREKGKSHK